MNTEATTLRLSEDESKVLPGGSLKRVARDQLRRKLRGLIGGQIRVRDGWGEWMAGDGGPVHDIVVHDPSFYWDVGLGGSLGTGESYIEGKWSTHTLTDLLRLFVKNAELTDGLDGGLAIVARGANWLRHRLNANSKTGSARNIHAHYDLGNDFFSMFLDPTMTYSCAVFEDERVELQQASIEKLDRLCRKLDLKAEHHVLEIGTGWGSFAIHAATHYGVRVTTTTISRSQYELASERIKDAGLSDRVEVLLADYRDLTGEYDRLVSIEMIEAVGHEYLATFFGQCSALLKADGAMALQAITMPDHRYAQYLRGSDFIRTFVFPGSCCPALFAMQQALAKSGDLKTVHVDDIGPHYALTLSRWRRALLANQDRILALGYPKRLLRLWDYYLCYCEAGFTERYIGTVQMVMHKPACRLRSVSQATGSE